MTEPTPLEELFDVAAGADAPLPPELARVYGRFALGSRPDRPWIIGNFVTTLDGVVSLGVPGHSGGGDISGNDPHDRLVMGLLRTVADAVIVGAGTLRSVPKHIWTADHVFPAFADAFRRLRTDLGKSDPPLTAIVTGGGEVDLTLPVFASGATSVLIVTTSQGGRRLGTRDLPASTRVAVVDDEASVRPGAMLDAVRRARPSTCILSEGGPSLIGDFFAANCLDELFLTLAPQIAGRDDSVERPGLVAGHRFAPEHPLWGKLVGIKRGASHLFLRYAFESPA